MADRESCELQRAHERLGEVHYFFHQMQQLYHDPTMFRYNLNAFMSALKSTFDFIRLDLERAGHTQWWKAQKANIKTDPILAGFQRGRNVSIHQKEVFEGSQIEAGLFRGRDLRLALSHQDGSARTSAEILDIVRKASGDLFIDERHADQGEQLGLLRRYVAPEISATDHVALASSKAFARITELLALAHEPLGREYDAVPETDLTDPKAIARTIVLLESDVDPSLPERWGWSAP